MSEYTIETRRRSRSKTPFLRSNCDHENCDHVGDELHTHHHKKKVTSLAPNVKTIVEETVEVTSSSSVGTGKDSPSKMAQTKIKTSDYSSEESPENKKKIPTPLLTTSLGRGNTQQQQQHLQITTETRSSSKVVSKTTKVRDGSLATSTPKLNNYVTNFAAQFASRGEANTNEVQYQQRRHKEHTQNLINTEKELNSSENKSFGALSVNSFADKSANFDASDHIAYLEYKKAGEYWKTTPKTDYTYSELSPHRRELAPGIVAMPNMSRQTLENHHERINFMIKRNPAQEEHIRRRYESPNYYQNRKAAERLAYESGDEVDFSQYQSRHKQADTWLMRLITTIVTTITTTWSTITGSKNASSKVGNYSYNSSSMYHTKLANEERGFFGAIVHGITSAFLAIVRNIYLFISAVLCLDTWFLQSSNADSKGKKRFLLVLLILLPLLLLAAWWLLDEHERLLYLQRWHSLLPLSLVTTLRSSLFTNFHTLKSFLPLFASSSSHSTSQNMEDLKLSLSKTMPPEEYEHILNHINSYINSLVEIKLQEQQKQQQQNRLEKDSLQLDSKQSQLIVQLIKENLKAFAERSAGSLSDNDLNLIIEKIFMKLQDSSNLAKTLILSPQNIEEIRNLIAHTIEINNNEHYKLFVERIDLDVLIEKLLKATLFTDYLQNEVSAQLNHELQEKLLILQQSQASGDDQYKLSLAQQKLLIDNLNKDIAFIKLALNDKLSENEDLHYSVKHLQETQDALTKHLQDLKTSTNRQLANLLQEITLKLNTLENEQFKLLNQQVKLSLIEILGFKATTKDGAQLSELDVQNWVRNMFVAKDYLELRLNEINNRTNDKIKHEIDKSGMFLMRDISERLKQEIIVSVENKQTENQAVLKGQIRDALSEEGVRNIVKSVLAIYDADKTGLVDFALESAGGQILSTRCTENYQTKTAQLSVFGIPLWYPTNTPRIAISPNVQPGECWAFQGFPGFLVLKLNSLVYVTGFTLEHIPKSLAPNGHIDSAPRNFTVWGLEHEKDQEPILFGEYEYTDNDASLQYFPLKNKDINRPYEIVELRVESNHGHPLYTCLYRFRVHGKPPAA